MAANFQQFFLDQINDLLTRSNDKYTCIEDQFYSVDKFPKYKQDEDTVFKCTACDKLIHVDCLAECDRCEQNFCEFKHTDRSICKQIHDCAETHLKYVDNRLLRICIPCIDYLKHINSSNKSLYEN